MSASPSTIFTIIILLSALPPSFALLLLTLSGSEGTARYHSDKKRERERDRRRLQTFPHHRRDRGEEEGEIRDRGVSIFSPFQYVSLLCILMPVTLFVRLLAAAVSSLCISHAATVSSFVDTVCFLCRDSVLSMIRLRRVSVVLLLIFLLFVCLVMLFVVLPCLLTCSVCAVTLWHLLMMFALMFHRDARSSFPCYCFEVAGVP